jgi:hypothetical protein
MPGMPDLPAFHYINDIVMMTPKVLKSVFETAVIAGEKGVTNGQPFATTGIICYM